MTHARVNTHLIAVEQYKFDFECKTTYKTFQFHAYFTAVILSKHLAIEIDAKGIKLECVSGAIGVYWLLSRTVYLNV